MTKSDGILESLGGCSLGGVAFETGMRNTSDEGLDDGPGNSVNRRD